MLFIKEETAGEIRLFLFYTGLAAFVCVRNRVRRKSGD